ncbi:tRNA (adenine(22)-N(1))-methyltransferase [uncultured Robinsoniella sp.]|uniref:tRNA (adenine(22)-N(1))-methyltransferase n=1 Tax=uncultured Robinsoniella sp. TaxID=904190 RepID=UPI00374E2F2F
MQLSKRLLAVSEMVTSNSRLADIGTDHGYIPIYLIENKRIPRAIAMDVNKGPLNRAKENIELHGLGEYIETRLSDGAAALHSGEADAVVIAGMGGGLVIKILTEGSEVLESVKELILQPQSELAFVRRHLQDNHYAVIEENMVLDDGKYYPMMKVIHDKMDYEREIDFKYGKLLLEQKNECLKSFLDKEERTYEKVLETLRGNDGEHAKQRIAEVEHELECIRTAKEDMA